MEGFREPRSQDVLQAAGAALVAGMTLSGAAPASAQTTGTAPGTSPGKTSLGARALPGVSLLVAVVLTTAPASAQERPGRDYSKIPDGAYPSSRRFAPGRKESELRAATLPLVALVRGDPNNLVYFLQEDRSTPGHFIFYEVFANKEDFEAHNAMPYVKAWLARLPELSDGGVTVMRMEVLNGNR